MHLAAGASAGAGESVGASKAAVKRETKEEREGVQAAKPTARRPAASKQEGKGKAVVKLEQEDGDEGSEEVAPKKRKANGFTKQIACVLQPASDLHTMYTLLNREVHESYRLACVTPAGSAMSLPSSWAGRRAFRGQS